MVDVASNAEGHEHGARRAELRHPLGQRLEGRTVSGQRSREEGPYGGVEIVAILRVCSVDRLGDARVPYLGGECLTGAPVLAPSVLHDVVVAPEQAMQGVDEARAWPRGLVGREQSEHEDSLPGARSSRDLATAGQSGVV